jgi:S1-C subfamily serine protease
MIRFEQSRMGYYSGAAFGKRPAGSSSPVFRKHPHPLDGDSLQFQGIKKPGKLKTLLAATVLGLSSCTSGLKSPSAPGHLQSNQLTEEVRNLLPNGCIGQPEISQGKQSVAFRDFQRAMQGLAAENPVMGMERIPRALQWLSPSVPFIIMNFVDSKEGVINSGSLGAGIVIDDRHIVTNRHVIDAPKGFKVDKIKVIIYQPNGRILHLAGRVKATADKLDLAILEVDVPKDVKLKPAAFRMNDIVKGLPVVAIGNPLGLANSATAGIVSLVDHIFATVPPGLDAYKGIPLLMTDTAINPGNSGGALADTCGAVIGMPSFVMVGMQNMNFAIPSKAIVEFLKQHNLKPDVRTVYDPVLNPLQNMADGKVRQPKTATFA